MSEESEKTASILAKIKPKQWKAMGKTVEQMKEFTEEAGMGDFVSDLKDTLSLQIADVLAPLKNDVNEAVMEALKPILPEIVTFMTGITETIVLGIDAWEAILTGRWDAWFSEQTLKFQTGMDSWSDDLKAFHLEVQKARHAWDKNFKQFVTDWENFWKDPLGSIGQLREGVNAAYNDWAAGVGQDLAAGWSGFWRDTGLF